LIRWPGVYADVEATWLRWATLEGELLPTAQEVAAREQQRADAEARRAAAAEAEVTRLRALLAGQIGSESESNL
jgi:hypothetical protein